MATDFSKVGNAIHVTDGTARPQAFVGYPVRYSFNAAGNTLSVSFGNGASSSYTVPLADLRVAGAGSPPADVAAAYTALSAVFGLFP
jgi:hypothetical protein